MSEPCTILIADDDPDVVELLRVYLRTLNCTLIAAHDGDEALTKAQQLLPDLVLLDVMMPKRSGWEVCQALKAVQRTSGIGVVLITGKGDVKDRLTGLQMGADDYLVKPFDRNEVVRRIQNLINARLERAEPKDLAGADGPSLQNLLYDRATSLPSIPLVIDRVKEILIEKSQIGVIFIDIEQFEATEEEYGWAFFDEFLRRVGDVLGSESARRDSWILASNRVGGSSFYLFLDVTAESRDFVEATGGEIHSLLTASLPERFPSMHAGRVGFFVGASKIEYVPQIRLERQIYAGMKKAADAVRTAEQIKKRQMTREMRDIIRRKRVTTLFQPIVRAHDQSIFGYEILTRGPSHSSFRNSDMLFSFARESGLAWDLESLSLESLLGRLRETVFDDKKFLINLEAEMFGVSDFKFHDMIAFFGKHRGNFVFELTERAAIEDYAAFRELLEGFRAQGIEIAIDDAGSGYASLEAIAALAPDYLKITKALVSTLAVEPIKQDLVKMLVDLASKIGAKTIAEGIETREEYDCCRTLGIDLLQGYYIALPEARLLVEPAIRA